MLNFIIQLPFILTMLNRPEETTIQISENELLVFKQWKHCNWVKQYPGNIIFAFSYFFLILFFLPVYLLFRNIFNKFSLHQMLHAYQFLFITQYHNIPVQFKRMGSQIAINRQTHQHCYCGNTIDFIVWR